VLALYRPFSWAFEANRLYDQGNLFLPAAQPLQGSSGGLKGLKQASKRAENFKVKRADYMV
jgi:hypothetical protein